MPSKTSSFVLAASLLVAPAFAFAQADNTKTPTADSAAAQVGKVPPAAQDENGKRVEPSKKLWNNPRTEAEQPGTQPPPNDKQADTTETTKQSLTAPHAYQPGKHKNGKHMHQKSTPPHTETQPEN